MHEHEKCELKYLKACTVSIFDRTLGTHCRKHDLLLTYQQLAAEFSRIATAGAGDRHCVFHTNLVDCEKMDFFNIRKTEKFVEKFVILAEHIFDWCGKDALRAKLATDLNKLVAASIDDCSSAPSTDREIIIEEEEVEATTTMATTTSTTILEGWTHFETTTTGTTTTTTTTTSTTTTTTTTEMTTMTSTTMPMWKQSGNAQRWEGIGGIRDMQTTPSYQTTMMMFKTFETTTPLQFTAMQKSSPAKTKGYSTVGEGLCSSRSYGYKSAAIFHARSYNVKNMQNARTAFVILATQISHLGKKLTRSRAQCNLAEAGKVPCELLDFPIEEEGCQLAQRLHKLYAYILPKCNEGWVQKYAMFADELLDASQPADGVCPDLGNTLARAEIREMNSAHEDEFEKSVKEAISESLTMSRSNSQQDKLVIAQLREERQRATEQREKDKKLRVEQRQKNIEIAKAQRARERGEAREERRMEMARTRLANARLLAEKRLADAKEQLAAQMQALDRVNEAVMYSMTHENPSADMLLDAVVDVVIDEAEELEEEMDEDERLRYGTKELDMYDILGEEEEKDEESTREDMSQSVNLHQTCMLPHDSHENLIPQAHEKFQHSLRLSMKATRTHRLKANLSNRLSQRYYSVLKFILNGKRKLLCGDAQTVRCYDLEAVFGTLQVPDIEILIAHSTELVQSLEKSCPHYLFSTFYMTLDGKTDRFM